MSGVIVGAGRQRPVAASAVGRRPRRCPSRTPYTGAAPHRGLADKSGGRLIEGLLRADLVIVGDVTFSTTR
jgi:hypothetical protein